MGLPSRKLPRLKGYDYAAQGYYYITICAHDKENIFGWVGNGLDRSAVHLSKIGKIAEEELLEIPTRYDGVRIDDYIVMPNHIHLILILGCDLAERSRPFPTVSEIIGLYKSGVSRRIHAETEYQNSIWQKSFYDTVLTNGQQYISVREYITYNPIKWKQGKGTDF